MNDIAKKIEPIDVEAIMEEIRADIADHAYNEKMIDFEDIDPEDSLKRVDCNAFYDRVVLQDAVSECIRRQEIPWYRPVEGNAFVRFVKKVMRKSTAFFVAPIADDQSCYNRNVTESLSQLLSYIDQQEKKMKKLQEEVDAFKAER